MPQLCPCPVDCLRRRRRHCWMTGRRRKSWTKRKRMKSRPTLRLKRRSRRRRRLLLPSSLLPPLQSKWMVLKLLRRPFCVWWKCVPKRQRHPSVVVVVVELFLAFHCADDHSLHLQMSHRTRTHVAAVIVAAVRAVARERSGTSAPTSSRSLAFRPSVLLDRGIGGLVLLLLLTGRCGCCFRWHRV